MYSDKGFFNKVNILWCVLICSVVLVLLNVIRIIHVPVTYDEAFTYNTYVTNAYKSIVAYENPTANNHILNTILTKFFVETFHNHLFFLRFANLLAQIIFLVFSFLIVDLIFKNKWLALGGFLIINMNPILLEFFGLCRGYGLAISLMMGSIYFLVRYLNSYRILYLAVSLLFSVAAVYSNFTMINYLLALAGVVVLEHLAYRKITLKRFFLVEFPVLLLTAALVYVLVAGPIRKLENTNGLFYGGDKSFSNDTICSLVKDYFFIIHNETLANFVVNIFIGSFVLITIYLAWGFFKNKNKNSRAWVFYLMFVIPALSTIVQHYLLGTKFLISRTALFFIPLYVLLILSVVQTLKPRLCAAIVLIAALFASVDLCKNYNTNTSWSWQFDRYDLDVIKKMERVYHGNKITVGASGYLIPSLQYYTATAYKKEFTLAKYITEVNKNDTIDDFYYIEKDQVSRMSEKYEVDTVFGNEFALMVKKHL